MKTKTKVITMSATVIVAIALHEHVKTNGNFHGLIGGTNSRGFGFCLMVPHSSFVDEHKSVEVVIIVFSLSGNFTEANHKDRALLDSIQKGLADEMCGPMAATDDDERELDRIDEEVTESPRFAQD